MKTIKRGAGTFMKNKNSWLILVFFTITLMVVGTFKYASSPNVVSAQEQSEDPPQTTSQENLWSIRHASLYSYHPLLKPGHPAYEAEKEKLKDTIAQVGEKNVKIQVRGDEVLMLEIAYKDELNIHKREFKVLDKEKNVWHSYAENPFFNAGAPELYTGEPMTDTVLMTLDFLTFFARGFTSDFTEQKKEIGSYFASVEFYNEKSPVFRRFFRFLQTHEDTETNRLSFLYEIAEEYNLEKDQQPPHLNDITSNTQALLKLKSVEGDKTKLSEQEIKDIEQALK
ncbi:MAG: hypothetical protein HYY62_01100, partial [Deltaproteobacteria bacterium]|nr:hypothetical protein [Deltaproteobacteria bacterium]